MKSSLSDYIRAYLLPYCSQVFFPSCVNISIYETIIRHFKFGVDWQENAPLVETNSCFEDPMYSLIHNNCPHHELGPFVEIN